MLIFREVWCKITVFIFHVNIFQFSKLNIWIYEEKKKILVARRRSQFVRAFTLEVLFCWEYRLLHVGWLKNATLDGALQFLNCKKVFHYIRMNSNGYISHTEELQQPVTGRLCSGWSPVPNPLWSATWRIQIAFKLWTFSALTDINCCFACICRLAWMPYIWQRRMATYK